MLCKGKNVVNSTKRTSEKRNIEEMRKQNKKREKL
jgi:hypothetical protein